MVFRILDWEKKEVRWVMGVVMGLVAVSAGQLRIGEMRTRDAQRRADAELVARGLVRYFEDHQVYPPASDKGEIVSCGQLADEACRWGEGRVVDLAGVVYIKRLPKEPWWEKGYRYVYETDEERRGFRIYIALEYRRDPVYQPDLTKECGPGVQCGWYAGF